jgi:hypothetical protein
MRENLWRMLVRKARSHWFKTENDRRENEMIKSSERELGGDIVGEAKREAPVRTEPHPTRLWNQFREGSSGAIARR